MVDARAMFREWVLAAALAWWLRAEAVRLPPASLVYPFAESDFDEVVELLLADPLLDGDDITEVSVSEGPGLEPSGRGRSGFNKFWVWPQGGFDNKWVERPGWTKKAGYATHVVPVLFM